MRRSGLLVGPLVWLFLLGGCAQPPGRLAVPDVHAPDEPSARQFRLEGRVAVKTGTQAFSGGIRWRHDDLDDEIQLSSPLGQGVAELRRAGSRVSLTDAEGRIHEADSGEALLEGVLGVRLPLDDLLHWLFARPRPGTPHGLERDADGRVMRIEQDGWQLDYGRYKDFDGRVLPGRIFARHGDVVEFRLAVDAWQIIP